MRKRERRLLEINHLGESFHETFPGDLPLPDEVWHCGCEGEGVNSFNPHTVHAAHELVADEMHPDGERPLTLEEWKAEHQRETCAIRRQFFVDVTNRPEAKLGMSYDEKTDTFSGKGV